MADAEVLFAGAQGEFVGLDQCNVRLSPSLAGSGEISRSADGGRQNLQHGQSQNQMTTYATAVTASP